VKLGKVLFKKTCFNFDALFHSLQNGIFHRVRYYNSFFCLSREVLRFLKK
jgi:hypothetical protein